LVTWYGKVTISHPTTERHRHAKEMAQALRIPESGLMVQLRVYFVSVHACNTQFMGLSAPSTGKAAGAFPLRDSLSLA